MKAVLKYFLLSILLFIIAGCTQYSQNSSYNNDNKGSFKPLSRKQRVVLLLPLTGQYSTQAKMIQNGFMDSLNGLKDWEKDSISVEVVDTQFYPNIDAAYKIAAAYKPTLIVGPLTQSQVSILAHRSNFPVPILTLNQMEPMQVAPLNFYQFSLNPNSDASALADYMSTFNLKHVIFITPNNAWAQGIMNTFMQTWRSHGGKLLDKIYYTPSTDINNAYQHMLASHKGTELAKAGVVVIAKGPEAVRIIPEIVPQASQLPVFALPMIYNGNMNLDGRKAISDVIFQSTGWLMYGDSLPRQTFTRNYPGSSGNSEKVYAFGHDAFLIANYYLQHHNFENVSIEGYMGYFTMGDNHLIHRQMPWVKLLNGQFTILTGLPTTAVKQEWLE